MTHINELVHECYNASRLRGWWDDELTADTKSRHYIIATKFALIHSEVSEGMEAYRKNTTDAHIPELPGVDVELADVCIRVFDLAGRLNIDLENVIQAKLKYNKQRLDHDLEHRKTDRGKKF